MAAIVRGDEDRGRMAVTGDGHALMRALDLRDVLREPVSRITKRYSNHAHSVAKRLGKLDPSCHGGCRDARRSPLGTGLPPLQLQAGSVLLLSRALRDARVARPWSDRVPLGGAP